ncbi:response regulator transcription factor, partial [Anaerotignum propionicum]|uniref:response regulator transcription factor n=1 Tax=Anaerotignum propionicum TaxID=28446 RepID=UPI00289FDAE3
MKNLILIVDDEDDIISLLKDHFEYNDYDVLTAGSGEEAIKKVEQQPDIILLDINMPELDENVTANAGAVTVPVTAW